MARGLLVLLIAAWVLVQGLNGNVGRLTTGQIRFRGPAAPAKGGP